MPVVSKIVEVGGKKLLDGGVTDSIPLRAFQNMGFTKNVVVETRADSYLKTDERLGANEIIYRKYPEFLKAVRFRPKMYNDEKAYVALEEKLGNVFLIRPKEELNISRTDTNPDHLEAIYQIGRTDAEEVMDNLIKFLNE